MTKEVTPAGGGGTVDAMGGELEGLLKDLLAEHERLLALAGEHRAAIRGADAAALGECVKRQNQAVQRIAELETRRLTLAARMGAAPAPGVGGRGVATAVAGAERPTVTRLAASLTEPLRGRVMAIASRLREVLERLRKEHAALREAAGVLGAHMDGLMRQITGRLSHAGTYGRRGAVDARVQVVSALDVRM
jgi:hypothetical protein